MVYPSDLTQKQWNRIKHLFDNEKRGYDGGKKVKGRKHHIVTDIMGNILHVEVHATNIHDTKAGGKMVRGALEKYPPFAFKVNMNGDLFEGWLNIYSYLC